MDSLFAEPFEDDAGFRQVIQLYEHVHGRPGASVADKACFFGLLDWLGAVAVHRWWSIRHIDIRLPSKSNLGLRGSGILDGQRMEPSRAETFFLLRFGSGLKGVSNACGGLE